MDKRHRKTIIAGNWKMNQLASGVPAFVGALKEDLHPGKGEEVVLCVPFPMIPAMLDAAKGSVIRTGAQDVSAHDAGAYTGEVSGAMLADLGTQYCIIGHSERRAYHAESDALVNEKLKSLLKNGIVPIVCVGESLEQRDAGETLHVVSDQIKAGFAGISAKDAKGVVVAYEPIWAIGTGRTATAEQAQEVCSFIREYLAENLYDWDTSKAMSILYGGSMNAKNAAELLGQLDIDGGLIGGASLKSADFAVIVKAGNEDA